MSKFKVGDKVRFTGGEDKEINITSEMESRLGDVFTIKSITNYGNYRVEENEWFWGESNLELVNETVVEDVQKVLKVWELEEGKEYQEVTRHTKSSKFRLCNDELEYTFYDDWYNENEESTLGEILAYEFIEIKSKLEKGIYELSQTYSKEEIVQAVNKLYK